ncbi:hypothetical protein GCM10029978_052090 [Actinoallomurus acanthiterrae]
MVISISTSNAGMSRVERVTSTARPTCVSRSGSEELTEYPVPSAARLPSDAGRARARSSMPCT